MLAWTPSTKGKAVGSAMQVIPPVGPLTEDPDKWLAETRRKVRGKIVLIGKATVVPVNFTPANQRQPDDQVKAQYDLANPAGGRRGRGPAPAPDATCYTAGEVARKIDAMLVAGAAMMRINDAARGEGIIVAQQHRGYEVATAVPTVVLRNDDFWRVERLMADGDDVKLQFGIVNHIYPEGRASYNAIAGIPGTDKADEIVMLGGHLDSWHGGTGATDNAIGCAIMMEAARLIENSGVAPRRTIRVALWSGEEEGLPGSLAYVKEHFGTAESPKPEWYKLNAYFNINTGTGRIRGAGIFGQPEAAAVLRPALAQYLDWGVGGISPGASRVVGGTDSTSFNAGLPGIGMQQDPIGYNSMTHHTNPDTCERIIPDDVQQDAAIIAAAVLHLGNRDGMVPRFAKDRMPAYVAPPKF